MAVPVQQHIDGIPKGYEKLSVTASAQSLTVPSNTNRALLRLEDAKVRYRDDGTSPTASEGMPLEIGDTLEINGETNLEKFEAIRTGASSGTLYILYYLV